MVRLATALLFLALAAPAQAGTVPDGFTDSVALNGLTQPTSVRFSPAGRVVVAEKSGVIKEFDSLGDTTPTVIANLSAEVHNFWDRGLLGLALDPDFDTNGRLYALYTYNSHVPAWPSTSCPNPPGATGDGCVVSGRLSMIDGSGEHPLIDDWCQQFPSHSIGSLAWGQDGKLYVSSGDGASFNYADYGQTGNPCGDPANEGGALRSQDYRLTGSGDPVGLNGTIARVDPAHLDQKPEIVAYGLRNPFRITTRPGTGEVWAGDVGWNTSEEIDRLEAPSADGPVNFGWPCYEGPNRQPAYDSLDLPGCESLYTAGDATGPYWDYAHWAHPDLTDTCPTGGSSISGLAFYPAAGSFGDTYKGALFFADYTRNCIWVMEAGANGLPDKAPKVFDTGASGPVDLQIGPDGDLFYVDMQGGAIRRIRGSASVQTPTARATVNPPVGAAPLTVEFDGSGSSDPRNEALTYAWDFGDGATSTEVTPQHTYQQKGVYTAVLTVTDTGGNTDTAQLTVKAGTPPTVTLTAPVDGTRWAVGDTIPVAGSAADSDGHAIPPASLTWRINLRHCNRTSAGCHTHPLETFTAADGSSFVAPDHEYPSYLQVQLTATDGDGLSTTVTRDLYPKTVVIGLRSQPAGARLTLAADTLAAPFDLPVIQGSRLSVTAPSRWTLGDLPYTFSAWSDGRARTHEIVAAAPATYTARFTPPPKLSVTPSSLSFSAIAGSASPAPQRLSVAGPNGSAGGAVGWLKVARTGSTVTVAPDTAGLARGTYHSTVEVRSPGVAPVDVPVTLRVRPRTTGLVGAWGFDEGHGRTAHDGSRPHNPGRISGARWTGGRHGGALWFDGSDDRVTVARTRALRLSRLTLEAWVRPSRGGRRAVVVNGPAGHPAYGLYGGRRASGYAATTAVRGSALRRHRWSHLAFTFDGAIGRLYVNGRQVAQAPLSGTAVSSRGPLRIGGAAVPGRWFRGRIDDVRVYNRALTAAEIAVDRHTAVP